MTKRQNLTSISVSAVFRKRLNLIILLTSVSASPVTQMQESITVRCLKTLFTIDTLLQKRDGDIMADSPYCQTEMERGHVPFNSPLVLKRRSLLSKRKVRISDKVKWFEVAKSRCFFIAIQAGFWYTETEEKQEIARPRTMFKKEWLLKVWEGACAVDEAVCFIVDKDGETKGGELLYKPEKVISVTSQDGSIAYEEGVDYVTVDGGIRRTQDSRIPVVKFEQYCRVLENESVRWLETREDNTRYIVPDESIYKSQINVTYTHNDSWSGIIPESQIDKLPKTAEKLRNKDPLTILYYGDSITEGCEASGRDEYAIDVFTIEEKHSVVSYAPYLPTWAELVKRELCNRFEYDEITKINRAAGGSTSTWGVANGDKLLSSYKPDIAVVAFGMNDNCQSPHLYKEDIKNIIGIIRKYSPASEILLVSPMIANEEIACFYNGHSRQFEQALTEISREIDGVGVVPVHSIFRQISEKKDYYSISGNYVNHPNDYSVRIYAQAVLSAFGL